MSPLDNDPTSRPFSRRWSERHLLSSKDNRRIFSSKLTIINATATATAKMDYGPPEMSVVDGFMRDASRRLTTPRPLVINEQDQKQNQIGNSPAMHEENTRAVTLALLQSLKIKQEMVEVEKRRSAVEKKFREVVEREKLRIDNAKAILEFHHTMARRLVDPVNVQRLNKNDKYGWLMLVMLENELAKLGLLVYPKVFFPVKSEYHDDYIKHAEELVNILRKGIIEQLEFVELVKTLAGDVRSLSEKCLKENEHELRCFLRSVEDLDRRTEKTKRRL